MIKIVIGLLIFVLSSYIGLQLHDDAGYVYITINQWEVETTALFFALAIFLLFVVLYIVFRLTAKLLAVPHSLSIWSRKHRIVKANNQTHQGLVQFSEGYFSKATTHLENALEHTKDPLINYLTLARAAQELGNTTLRDQYLRQAQLNSPDATIAIELTQAQLQISQNQWEQALATLRHLHDLAPKHPYVLKQLMYLYQELKDWDALLYLIPSLKKAKIINNANADDIALRCHLGLLNQFKLPEDKDFIQSYLKKLPKTIRYSQDMQQYEIPFLASIAAFSEAEQQIKHWLKTHIPDENMHLTIAEVNIAQGLWGQAKEHIEQSLNIKPSAKGYYLQGILFEALGEPASAQPAFRKAAALSLNLV